MSSTSASSGEPKAGAVGRARLSALLRQHGIRPSRALGQNFLADPNTARRLVRLSGVGAGDRVVEIGAGLGSLTLPLAAAGARVTAVEVDRRLAAALREVTSGYNVEVVEADALSVDWGALLGGGRWVLVANLPYNIATPLVVELLEGEPDLQRMQVMVQREVAERLAAGPGSSSYGAVSVKVAYFAEARVVGHVPPTVFIPQPAVESALVSLVRRPAPAVPASVASYAEIVSLVEAGFAQRRKMLRRALAGLEPTLDAAAWAAAGVRPEDRAEDLDVSSWGRLAAARRAAAGRATPQGAR
ncbi:MAG TPA: 16S rRNA (adenine(1518)-N(6)/adenine(1519)-N(6))-dimethyltransferase RsmA [Acidimicrobiales bacterium]|nr:16S rRNA (adenine(1518)-N(6)/adenine(1519)-N(6))-dimethyltransferase RsmA [Acidimicrobiales bacterium]